MGQRHSFLEQLNEKTGLRSQQLPEQTIIEIAGDRRVLIENHYGVKEYSHEKIMVNVKFGCVCVDGCKLELMRMSRDQLVICGEINHVSLLRRGRG